MVEEQKCLNFIIVITQKRIIEQRSRPVQDYHLEYNKLKITIQLIPAEGHDVTLNFRSIVDKDLPRGVSSDRCSISPFIVYPRRVEYDRASWDMDGIYGMSFFIR